MVRKRSAKAPNSYSQNARLDMPTGGIFHGFYRPYLAFIDDAFWVRVWSRSIAGLGKDPFQ